MSSTSSSAYESDEYWQYEKDYDKNYRSAYGQSPFYPTMGHPLIYYAQVPQPIGLRRGRKRQRDSPNCFVKAFRWYTEERAPNRNMSVNKPDMAAFVAWLDTKYDEFLHECTMNAEMFRVTVKQTSVIEAERASNNAHCEPCSPKRFLRVKSPWKRKRRAKSNETGDLRQRSNQSFQYILQPKDISRPPSECCHPRSRVSVASECPKKDSCVKARSFSNITVVKSNDTARGPLVQKEVKRQKTNDNECEYCEANSVNVDNRTQYTDVQNSAAIPGTASMSSYRSEEVDKCFCPALNRIPRNPLCRGAHENISEDVQVEIVPKEHKNTSCQCPEKKIEIVDVQTQCENACLVKTFHNTCCDCDSTKHVQSDPSPVQSTSKVHQCPCEKKTKDEWVTEKMIVAVKFTQKSAQTSNHSIRLEKKAVHEYPLFMKIVCADKLSDVKDT